MAQEIKPTSYVLFKTAEQLLSSVKEYVKKAEFDIEAVKGFVQYLDLAIDDIRSGRG